MVEFKKVSFLKVLTTVKFVKCIISFYDPIIYLPILNIQDQNAS